MLRLSTWLVLFGLVLAGCGSTAQRCSTLTCTGCCDASGMCRTGSEASACGKSGNTCTACPAGISCSFGTCGTGSSGAGSAGAGTAGGGSSGGGSAGGGSGGGSANTVTDWASWCRAAASAADGFYGRCGYYTAQGAMEAAQANATACIERKPPGLADGRSSLNLAGAQACLTVFNSRTCAQGIPSGCAELLTGLVPRNGSCFETSECDATSWCDLSTTCPGTCVARIAVGQPARGDARCVENAYVFNGVCTALVAMGQSCAPPSGSTVTRACLEGQCINNVCGPRQLDATENMACAPNTQPECARGLQCVSSRCIPLVDVNGACDSVRSCKADLQCSPANVCVRAGGAGAACGPNLYCARDFFCNRPSGQTMGTCAAIKQVGATCAIDYECDIGTMYCTTTTAQPNGVCRLKGMVSAACTYDTRFSACGDGLYCTATMASPAGVCANRKSAGATCVELIECQSANCMTGRCTTPTCVDPTP